jgi:hypothetical protein
MRVQRKRAGVRTDVSTVNYYLAHKQHLLPGSRRPGVGQVSRDIVALHATSATGPYLSLWARVPGFQQGMLEEALYERRTLARLLCMRSTLHAVPSDEVPFFFQAYSEHRTPAERRHMASLLVQAGLCQESAAGQVLDRLQRQVLDLLVERGPSTVQQISRAVPELMIKVRHSVGKPYEGEFSVGSRLVPSLCTLGLLIRARTQGTWLSSLHTYAAMADWLPEVDLDSVTPRQARTWLARRYLAAFGPATAGDVLWWTGFSRGKTEEALAALRPELTEVRCEGLGDGYLMLACDARWLGDVSPVDGPGVFLLPGLDPYIMGYGDRRRFLATGHRAKVFDRAGNAMPTVWVDGRVAGAWGQRKDGRVVYGLFEPVGEESLAPLAEEVARLESFLGGEYLRPRSQTAFTRSLT